MLPTSVPPQSAAGGTRRAYGRKSAMVWVYLRRLFKPTQMDFQYTFWTMVQLCTSPKTA